MPASSKLDKDHSMDSIILKLVGVGLVAFELYNAVSITAITICSAKTFGKIHEQGTPLSGASLYTLLVAGSGMLMWVLLISRILTWRWTGWSQYRLKRAGSLVVGIITFWAVSIIILQQRQLNIQVDSLVKDLVVRAVDRVIKPSLTFFTADEYSGCQYFVSLLHSGSYFYFPLDPAPLFCFEGACTVIWHVLRGCWFGSRHGRSLIRQSRQYLDNKAER